MGIITMKDGRGANMPDGFAGFGNVVTGLDAESTSPYAGTAGLNAGTTGLDAEAAETMEPVSPTMGWRNRIKYLVKG